MPLPSKMPAELFDAAGNLVGHVTSMEMDQSITPFELTDATASLTKENAMPPYFDGCNSTPLISERLVGAVACSPELVVDELQTLLNQAYENIEEKERQERKRKKAAKRERREGRVREIRRESALAVLERATHKRIDAVRITAAMALLDRLG